MNYLPRAAEAMVTRYLRLFPVVGVSGPRQSGKSTMVRHLLGGRYRYVSFDDLGMVRQCTDDPEQFMRVYADRVIFDEVQCVPELLVHIKRVVDGGRQRYGRFVVTGSSQFSLMRGVSESLAGRIGLLTLLPMQAGEIAMRQRAASVLKGSYPELVRRGHVGWSEWYEGYLGTYLDRDVRMVSAIGDMRDFHRFLRLLAARCSQLLNLSTFASDLGVAVPTVKRWLSVLEASYIAFLLPPYHGNPGKRIIKSPKVYFYDTGLVCHLTGVDTARVLASGPSAGALFENYIISELAKREAHLRPGGRLSFYRTSHGDEVDCVIERGGRREMFEVKLGETFRPEMTRTMEAMLRPTDSATLVYSGRDMPYRRNVRVVNAARYLAADLGKRLSR